MSNAQPMFEQLSTANLILLCFLCLLIGATVALLWERRRFGPRVAQMAARIRNSELGTAVLPFFRAKNQDFIGGLSDLADAIEELLKLHDVLTTNIAASVLIMDRDRKVLFCSPFTTVLTGLSLEELNFSADPLLQMVDDEDRERFLRAWNVSCLGEEIHVRYKIRHKSGLTLWLETRFVPIHDENDQVTAVLGVTIDLTDTMDRQRQIEEKNRDLEDFTYMVSHDLKAPIFTMKGMATILKEDFSSQLGAEGNEYLRYIAEASDRLEKMIGSVLAYSRLATQPPTEGEIALDDVLKHVQKDLGQQIKETNAEISVETLPTVWGDPVRIYQVFSNLLGNAIKYRETSRVPRVRIRALTPVGGFANIEFSDNGSGIPEDKLSDIFRPYQRAHGTEIEGSGIGLACVKKIVEGLGGAVTVRSKVGEGSVFCVALPLPKSERPSIPEDLRRTFHEWT